MFFFGSFGKFWEGKLRSFGKGGCCKDSLHVVFVTDFGVGASLAPGPPSSLVPAPPAAPPGLNGLDLREAAVLSLPPFDAAMHLENGGLVGESQWLGMGWLIVFL